MADTSTRTAAPEDSSSPTQRGIWMIVFGSVLAVLAPLAGFLGGTKAGASVADQDIDPLLQWLIAGLGIGGIGVLLASVGMLRWVRANRHRRLI